MFSKRLVENVSLKVSIFSICGRVREMGFVATGFLVTPGSTSVMGVIRPSEGMRGARSGVMASDTRSGLLAVFSRSRTRKEVLLLLLFLSEDNGFVSGEGGLERSASSKSSWNPLSRSSGLSKVDFPLREELVSVPSMLALRLL